ncbi:MAG: pilus assembly protein [Oscillospiraceae bacterium]|nr:pilus assembly protein [Oscillospiraceae bacterium]
MKMTTADCNEMGALTIEASLALPVFLVGFIVILSLAAVVFTEYTVANGVNQTAAEIARYCYITQRISDSQEGELLNEGLDDLITNVVKISSLNSDEQDADCETGSLIKSLAMLTSNRAANNVLGCRITDILCRRLITKYIGGSREEADSFLLRAAGITLDDIDFRGSSVLKNSKEVNVVAVYRVKINTFGLFESDRFSFIMENSACTCALGVRDITDEKTYCKSKWMLGNFERGSAWAYEIKSEHQEKAVCPGSGIDLYDSSTNTFTQIYSVNIFAQSYTEYEACYGKSGADCYKLKNKYYEEFAGTCAKEVIKNMNNISSGVSMEAGTALPSEKSGRSAAMLFVLPQETEYNENLLNEINQISQKISKKTGVKIEYTFREKALLIKDKAESS